MVGGPKAEFLETGDALRFSGISKKEWDNVTLRGLYPGAPEARQGQSRRFGPDDLVAAYILGFLLQCEVRPSFAGQIATDVLRELRRTPPVETLAVWKCTKADGQPYVVVRATEPRTRSIRLFEFPIARIRQLAREGIRKASAPNPARS